MCCFSGPVQSVSGTKIFARLNDKGQQYVVYQMRFEATEDVAMILPIPTSGERGEDAVEFINLEDYENFFGDMENGFPSHSKLATMYLKMGPSGAISPLEVHDVGSFEASFVPTVADFHRLDERFRLPDGAWDSLPAYQKFGFAVFKLKSSEHEPHPMAFRFDSALEDQLFFPTVHIHDGEVHKAAEFDHTLYFQGGAPLAVTSGFPRRWRESTGQIHKFVDHKKAKGVVAPDFHAYQMKLRGRYVNRDIRVVPQFV